MTFDYDRTTGLGASESAAVVGLDPWNGPNKLWKLKTGRRQADATNDAMRVGTALEPYILREAERLLDAEILSVPEWQPEPGREWRRRSLDGVCSDLRANVQVKTSSARDKWGESWSADITSYVLPQVHHEMSWTFWREYPDGKAYPVDFERSFVPVLFIPEPAWRWRKLVLGCIDEPDEMAALVAQLDLEIYEVPRDERKEALLLAEEERFWSLVQSDVEPAEDFVNEDVKKELAR